MLKECGNGTGNEDSLANDLQDFYQKFSQMLMESFSSESTTSTDRIQETLKQLTLKYVGQEKYSQDVRYLKLWLLYAKFSWDPNQIYQTILTLGIGQMEAILYEEAANFYEMKEKNIEKAKQMYHLGMQHQAKPKASLLLAFEAFQKRCPVSLMNATVTTSTTSQLSMKKEERPAYLKALFFNPETLYEESFEEVRARHWQPKAMNHSSNPVNLVHPVNSVNSVKLKESPNPFMSELKKKKKRKESTLLKRLNEHDNDTSGLHNDKENTKDPFLHAIESPSADPTSPFLFSSKAQDAEFQVMHPALSPVAPMTVAIGAGVDVVKVASRPLLVSSPVHSQSVSPVTSIAAPVETLEASNPREPFTFHDYLLAKAPESYTLLPSACQLADHLRRLASRATKPRKSLHPRQSIAFKPFASTTEKLSPDQLPFELGGTSYRYVQKLNMNEVETYLVQQFSGDLDVGVNANESTVKYSVLRILPDSYERFVYAILQERATAAVDQTALDRLFHAPLASFSAHTTSDSNTSAPQSICYTLASYASPFTLQDVIEVNRISKNTLRSNEKWIGLDEILVVYFVSFILDILTTCHRTHISHGGMKLENLLFVHEEEQEESRVDAGLQSTFNIRMTNLSHANIFGPETLPSLSHDRVLESVEHAESFDRWLQSTLGTLTADLSPSDASVYYCLDYYQTLWMIHRLLFDQPTFDMGQDVGGAWFLSMPLPATHQLKYMTRLWSPLFKTLLNPYSESSHALDLVEQLKEYKEICDQIVVEYQGKIPSLKMLLKRLSVRLYEL